MAELLVFTLLAAIAAVYSILPRHRQLRVRYSLWTRGGLGFIGLMFIVIILTYWLSILVQSREQNTLSISILDRSTTITPLYVESVQLVAILSIVALFTILFMKSNVRIRNEDNLLEILRNFYNQEEYTTLVNLLKENYRPLINHPSSPVHPESLMKERWVIVEAGENQQADTEWEEDEEEEEEGEEGKKEDEEEEEELNKAWRRQIRETRQKIRFHLTNLRHRVSNTVDDWSKQIKQKSRLLRYYVARLRYRTGNTAEDASEYSETLLLDPDFAELYSDLASELGLEILRDDSLENFRRQDVVHRYLRAQLKTENTLLYRDLEQNTASDGSYGYKLEEENRLVYGLFSDFERAKDLNVYKPIGDQTQEIIRQQRREEFDEYNDQRLSNTRIQDDYIFRDPVFVGIQFFDVMVRAAFDQEVSWHVWLSYYESFTREICRNYETTEYSDPDAEWPNDYSRLLYEMVSNMRNWIKMMEEELKPDTESDQNESPYVLDVNLEVSRSETESLSEVQNDSDNKEQAESEDRSDDEKEQQDPAKVGDHLQLGSISTDRVRRNIPEMTVIILISCHEEILTTDDIPLQFMDYITETILLCLLDLREYGEGSLQWRYSELMLHCLSENLTGNQADPRYHENLKRVYRGDYGGIGIYGVRHEVSVKDNQMTDLVEELDEIIGS
ncbi:hypothetical protein GWG54_16985 [Natronococcus sp. JC468]|uniref:hypothetical protein n=1 Tax=Natronococcus sp. JC468 TaxID=1961921 RepID=UPI001438B61D|nr:hypothetical protein [Natronococcus sp. JC468]NKE37472.1 hypothetical protein [Natronococcus sp. JC468]